MRIYNSIAIFLSLLMLSACNSDLERVYFDEEQSSPATLAALDEQIVLDVEQGNKPAFVLSWEAPKVNYDAAITTNVEMDLGGKKFANPTILTSLKGANSFEVLTADFNAILVKIISDNEMEFGPLNLEFRLVSSISESIAPLISNVVSCTITPFLGEKVYPQTWVVGDYCGWSHDNAQLLYSKEDDGIYEAMVYFNKKAANGWKLTAGANWTDGDWGGSAEDAPEESPLNLVKGSWTNIQCYSYNSYEVKFDKNNEILTMGKGRDEWALVGDFNGWGTTPDTPLTYGTETDIAGKVQHYLTVTADFVANSQFAFRADSDWGSLWNTTKNSLKYDDKYLGKYYSEGDGKYYDNFVVKESGNYTLIWYFNKVEQKLIAIKND